MPLLAMICRGIFFGGSSLSRNNLRNEYRTVIVMALCFGLVGIDRFVINPLFPAIANDLALDYRDMGVISGSLAAAWGAAAIIMGRVADKIGIKVVLVLSTILFSALFGAGGMASSLVSLLCLRVLTGLAEGAFVPACFVATSHASHPSRVGLNIGILHVAFTFCGFGLAPLLATQLLKILPSWRWVFGLIAVPGFILAYCVQRVLQPDCQRREGETGLSLPFWAILTQRRIMVNAVVMVCRLSSVSTLGVFLPSYLIKYHGLGMSEMGVVLSSMGVGSVLGMVVLPSLGDRVGYWRIAVVGAGLSLSSLGAFCLAPSGVKYLFLLLFLMGLTGGGVTAIVVGPLTSAAVPPRLATTATGIIVGLGEFLGGALSPVLAGYLANRHGIAVVPGLAFIAGTFGFLTLLLGGHHAKDQTKVQISH